MPKNAVQRLQKIDKDIKTVLSIYDIANSANEKLENAKKEKQGPHFSEIDPPKLLDNLLFLDKLGDQTRTQSASHLFGSLKQIGTYLPQLEQCASPRDPLPSRKTFCVLKKPSSAPSSSSTLSTICESDHRGQLSSESLKDASEWIESYNVPNEYDGFMSPSKALLTANEILAKNNYKNREKNESLEFRQEVCYASEDTKTDEEPQEEKVTPKAKAAPSYKRYFKSPIKSNRSKVSRDSRKENTVTEASPPVPDKEQKGEKSSTLESKLRYRFRSKRKESMERLEKGWSIGRAEDNNSRSRRDQNSSGHEKKSSSASDKDRKTQPPLASSTQKTRKSPGPNDTEMRAKELSKIIERSNEKLEKMKASKELALDIAKQLKDKYDKIQHSKDELMEKLQSSEKDNMRLNNEIKVAQESQVKLQLKMEGLRKTSRTKIQEQEIKIKEVLEENAWLKAKIIEMEKDQSEKLLEKQSEIDRLQKERLSEIKKELKNRENRAGDVQKLMNEKSELSAKVEELRSSLKGRQTKVESLESKILQLQEEIQKQKQNLKKKTERLEETNKELESIRKNSNDLEDQVKTLRKNIENFDDLHKNLMKDHEHQMKIYQEEIQILQDEKSKLIAEVENKKDALLIKTKIIDDQQETIKKLREKSDETKTLIKRNQSLERVLDREREEKLELQEALERLKWRKEELKAKIKSLESDLLLAPQEVVRDLQKTQMVLHELEHQVQIKQKEWEVHLQALTREKEQACSVAEFATRKLMQTTSEFQKQFEAQKRLHHALAENLAEKERHLREVTERLSKQKMTVQTDTRIYMRSSPVKNNQRCDNTNCPVQMLKDSAFPFQSF